MQKHPWKISQQDILHIKKLFYRAFQPKIEHSTLMSLQGSCLLYTSDAADDPRVV